MEPAEGQLEIEPDDGVVTVRGDLDMDTVGQLTQALDELSDTVVLVLDELSFIDSCGLQGILNAQRAARERATTSFCAGRPSRSSACSR